MVSTHDLSYFNYNITIYLLHLVVV